MTVFYAEETKGNEAGHFSPGLQYSRPVVAFAPGLPGNTVFSAKVVGEFFLLCFVVFIVFWPEFNVS